MPIKKKKCFKKKKKKNNSVSTKKNQSPQINNEDIVCGTSRGTAIIVKKPDTPRNMASAKECYNICGVKRLFSPNNQIPKIFTQSSGKKFNSNMTYESAYKQTGLSSKERCYVICSCQARAPRYQILKQQAANAIKENKIFTVYGSCNAVRKALLDRGWIEKIPPNRMNLAKIRNGNYEDKNEMIVELERLLLSNLVEKTRPSFLWLVKDEFRDTSIDMGQECNMLVNKLKIDAMWTTKQGLCTTLKGNYWFYIEDVAEVNSPRTYSNYNTGEVEDFTSDYKTTACTSLLKWVLSMVANERPIFVETGKITLNVVVFALNRCKEYLFRQQNIDIDKPVNTVSTGQWNAFLKKYYRLISKEDVFRIDTTKYKDNKLQLYLGYAKFLLKEIHRYRPQLSCEGCHNIWIIKPAHCSRGRGIRMASKLGVITNLLNTTANAKYVVQKYIEEPLLIHDTKFDIRQYYLITSTYPLVIWMYKDCYLKFSSQKYSLKNYHESIHLTNNAVQRKYKNCEQRHPELPTSNMWDSDTYKSYLIRIGRDKVWDKVIYPAMKKSIISIMLSCQDSLSYSKNRFELYGCDFILDKQYKTWLIEINSCPDLNHTTPVTAKICPAVVSDIIKVVIDYAENPKSSTGKFECVYRQPMSGPRYGVATDLSVRGYTLPLEYFYRGPVQKMESYDLIAGDKDKDVITILNKLKQIYDTDRIMVEPEDDDDSNLKKEQETFTHRTESEQYLHETATVITRQLDDLLDRIISEHSGSSKSGHKQHFIPSPLLSKEPSKLEPIQSAKSVTDVKSLLKRSLCRFVSSEAIVAKLPFNFSQLDDGSTGKNSATTLLRANVDSFPKMPSTAQNTIIQASSKILTFLKEKEKEYNKFAKS